MNRSRRDAAPAITRSPLDPSHGLPYADVLAGLALAAAAAVAFHGALGYFFSQDDFEGLSRARGLLPRLSGPWRLISNQLYFDVMRVVSDLRPFGYHLASLLAHQLATVLAYRYLRAWVSLPAAMVGAAFVAVHPSLFTALYWISAGSTIHSAVFALLALLAERTSGRRRWLAVPLYGFALCARETAIGLPVVMLAAQLQDRRARVNDPVMWSLAGVAIAFVLGMVGFDVIGLTTGHGAGAAYRAGLGPHVLANLSTYLAWSVNFLLATVRSFSDVLDPGAVPLAIAVAAVALGGCAVRALRARGWIVAWTLFALWIAPVLLLQHHTYHYYLYGPLIGIGWSLAIVVDVAFVERLGGAAPAPTRTRGGTPRAPWRAASVATLLAALLTWNGTALVHKIEIHPFLDELRADPSVDRAIIAGNVYTSLAATSLPAGLNLRFWSPMSIRRQYEEDPGAAAMRESYWERNVRAALLDGLAVRVLFPHVRNVDFVRTLTPAPDSTWYAVYRPDGNLGLATYAMLDSISRARAPDSSRARDATVSVR